MGQVNVNDPHGTAPDDGRSGAGFILGIIVAIIVIAALVYFLVLAPGTGNNGANDGNGGTDVDVDAGGDDEEPAPSGWTLTTIA